MKPELLRAKERLARNLSHLSCYCQPLRIPPDDSARDDLEHWRLRDLPGSYKDGFWPSRELLAEIENDVLFLAERKRAIFPVWKAFLQLNNRVKKLQLKSRVNDLIRRAQRLLSGESELNKVLRLAKAGDLKARCSLSNMILKPEKLDELLEADRQMMVLRDRARPLVYWSIDIGHPFANDWSHIVKLRPTVKEFEAWQRREKRRESVRRCRSRKKILPDLVTPF
jgi:hypothetical protein